ncbi:hypothetical protein ACP4OV_025611 [Aristida adscensionis]
MAGLRRDVRFHEGLLAVEGTTPLVLARLDELVGDDHAVVTVPETGDTLYVGVLAAVDRGLLKPSATVLMMRPESTVVGVLPGEAAAAFAAASSALVADAGRPRVPYGDVAGCEEQKREVREAVELPVTRPELFAQLGVDPPRGVLLCGPPSTGKTMLAKAVAHHTSAAFFRLSGAELVSKLGGGGACMVRDLFRLAREKAPSIVFIDEVDAVATARSGAGDSRADREANRVLVELLAQMDGFDGGGDDGVRMIMATNRAEAPDPALLRPGRLDRKVEFRPPEGRQKRLVYEACAAGMSLDGGVDMAALAARRDGMSAAEVAAVCLEAGMRAVRAGRCVVTREDFDEGYQAVVEEPECSAYHELCFNS